MQAIHYYGIMEECFPMALPKHSPVAAAMAAFSRSVAIRKDALGITSDRDLYGMIKKMPRVVGPSEKTVNNAVKGRHDAKISTLNAIAEALDLPLWVLLIPELPPELLQEPDAHRVVRLVQHFIASNGEGRSHIENIAAAAAYQSRKPLT